MQWIEAWLDAGEDPRFTAEILFTQYESFIQEHERFYRSIIEFYGIKQEQFQLNEDHLDKDKLHFRKGLKDEWREVFTPPQIERSAAIMTEWIMNRFGWS